MVNGTSHSASLILFILYFLQVYQDPCYSHETSKTPKHSQPKHRQKWKRIRGVLLLWASWWFLLPLLWRSFYRVRTTQIENNSYNKGHITVSPSQYSLSLWTHSSHCCYFVKHFVYRNFCLVKPWQHVLSYLSHGIRNPEISGSSSQWPWPWKGNLLNCLRTTRQPWPHRQRTCRAAAESGKKDGMCV